MRADWDRGVPMIVGEAAVYRVAVQLGRLTRLWVILLAVGQGYLAGHGELLSAVGGGLLMGCEPFMIGPSAARVAS